MGGVGRTRRNFKKFRSSTAIKIGKKSRCSVPQASDIGQRITNSPRWFLQQFITIQRSYVWVTTTQNRWGFYFLSPPIWAGSKLALFLKIENDFSELLPERSGFPNLERMCTLKILSMFKRWWRENDQNELKRKRKPRKKVLQGSRRRFMTKFKIFSVHIRRNILIHKFWIWFRFRGSIQITSVTKWRNYFTINFVDSKTVLSLSLVLIHWNYTKRGCTSKNVIKKFAATPGRIIYRYIPNRGKVGKEKKKNNNNGREREKCYVAPRHYKRTRTSANL